jgi:hypothetical protein
LPFLAVTEIFSWIGQGVKQRPPSGSLSVASLQGKEKGLELDSSGPLGREIRRAFKRIPSLGILTIISLPISLLGRSIPKI